ncbi:hypothetical protein [Nostoc sp. FACHB-110]|uniref:hypothetical protein n=1 Tax=Nostoc sp. FACHB-110 TaxID=2692834 RepID=UPI001684AA2C|nr:hypothetical protein [Nostoc sp. FACHB-110]MBD2435345.1 hypothetical protein [Nostoc sp. FACHB-110]
MNQGQDLPLFLQYAIEYLEIIFWRSHCITQLFGVADYGDDFCLTQRQGSALGGFPDLKRLPRKGAKSKSFKS